MDLCLIPQQDYVASEMTQEESYEIGYVGCLEIVLPESDIQARVFALSRHGERRECGYSVVSIAVANDRCLAQWSPGPATRGYEEETAFIEEGEVGTKS